MAGLDNLEDLIAESKSMVSDYLVKEASHVSNEMGVAALILLLDLTDLELKLESMVMYQWHRERN